MRLNLSWAGIVTYMLLIILVVNRAASKISIGPVYFLDALIFISLCKKYSEIIKLSRLMFCGPALALFGVGWLVYEMSVGEFDALNIRRFSVAFYMIVGIIIVIYGRNIANFFLKNIYISFLVIFLAYSLGLPNFQASIASQFMGLLLVAILFCSQASYVKRSILGLFIVIAIYVIVVFGLKGGGLYKTPLLGLFLSLFVIIFFRYFTFLVSGNKISFLFNIMVLFGLVVFLFSITFVSPIQSAVAEMFYAMSGLTGSETFSNIASGIADQQIRARGGSVGTAETRVTFWLGIFNHSQTSLNYFMIGNGHYLSFFDRIFIYSSFIESDLLEPHNSFLGIYYRYGIIGVFLFVAFMFQTRRYLATLYVPDKDILIACSIIALNFAMFEVALESPHGAIVFWFIWLFPYLAGVAKSYSLGNK